MALVSFRLLSIFCSFLILISQANAQPSFRYHFCINNNGNYTANSTYETNLITLLSNLSSNTEIDYGFYNFSHGQNSDKVNAIGLCRGDLKPHVCRSCLNDSIVLLPQKCPNHKEAIASYDNCMLRYSNRSIFGIMESSPFSYISNLDNVTDEELDVDIDHYNLVLRNLLNNLTDIASSGDSRSKFAARHASVGLQTLYGQMQCTPDLSALQCQDCLVGAISQIPSCCLDKIGGRVLNPSCNIRYKILPFYDATAEEPLALPQLPSPLPRSTNNRGSKGNTNTSRIVIATVVPIVAIIFLLVFICIYSRVRKSKKKCEAEDVVDDDIKTTQSLQFHFDTIRVATNNFSDANMLGKGGFGAVYKGKLTNGQEIAVKRLSMDSGQGNTEFRNEVLLVAKLQHRNLVRLLGFCLEGQERLLIYEFVQNKSLDYFIFDPNNRLQLNWKRRYKIIEGIARGLFYLHEDSRLRIIDRDLKASNILLDGEMNAKISNFGLARLVVVDQTQVNTNRIVGTYGYMAPEYAMLGQFSMKSDVFSFGVVILEIISGYKNTSICHGEYTEHLVSFTWKHWREGTVANIIDPTLDDDSRNEILRCIHIGLLCVQENIAYRPTMVTIVHMLHNNSLTLPLPSQPAFFMDSRSISNTPSWELNLVASGLNESRRKFVQESIDKALITQPYPR